MDSWTDCCSYPYRDEVVYDDSRAAVDNNDEEKDGEVNVAVEDGHNDDDAAMDDGDEVAEVEEPNTNSVQH